MDPPASVGVVFVFLRVITSLFLFLVSSIYADYSTALQSPNYCFLNTILPRPCLMKVEYPLERAAWSSNSCGYPGFEVDCDPNKYEGRPFINISNHIYHVLGVNYEQKIISLVDTDVVGGSSSGCPQPNRNFSFPSSPYWVNYHLPTAYNENVSIFYNCSSSVPADAEKHLFCSKEDANTSPSYAFYHDKIPNGFDWYGNCAQNVVVPVFSTRDSRLNFSSAIKRGFYMGWSTTNWCIDCEGSGGHCWSNTTATGCACIDRKSYNTTCPALTTTPPPLHQGRLLDNDLYDLVEQFQPELCLSKK